MVQRLYLHSSRRKPAFTGKKYLQSLCCVGAHRSLARRIVELCSVGNLLLRFARPRKICFSKPYCENAEIFTASAYACSRPVRMGYLFKRKPCRCRLAYELYARSKFVLIIVMSVFSTPVFGLKEIKSRRADLIKLVITAVLLIVSFICLIAETYNPFLYFRF